MHGHHLCPYTLLQRFLVFNLQATFHLEFLLNLSSGLLWQRSGHPIFSPGVKIMLWGVKNVINFNCCLCSSYRAKFLSDLFVSTRGIRWILWFSVRNAPATAVHREIFGVNTLRRKLYHLGSPNLPDFFIGGKLLWEGNLPHSEKQETRPRIFL